MSIINTITALGLRGVLGALGTEGKLSILLASFYNLGGPFVWVAFMTWDYTGSLLRGN